MKRLQFRHNNQVFQNRAEVIKYFADMVDSTNTASTIFKSSLYAEPLVAKYRDEDGNIQVIFAIGVDEGLTPYHIIDSKEIAELILANKTAIELESERAKASETSLNEAIVAEVNRASAAELSLSGSIDTEREERLAEVKKEREERIAAINEEREERLAADELESNARRDSDDYLQAQITKNISTIVPVTENLSANVREEYVLKNADGEEMGSHIKIYKDSALVGAEVNFKGATSVTQKADGSFEFTYGADMDKTVEYLYLIYRNENGGLNLVGLDFENFLMENEEGLGIKIVDHKITVKIKGGERYLTVTEDGVQTINISEDIEAASKKLNDELIAKLDAEIDRLSKVDEETNATINAFSASTISEFNKLSEEVHATIDSVSANTTSNIKRIDSNITDEVNRAQNAENELNAKIDSEILRASEVEAELTSAIEDEATTRQEKDAELNTEIVSNRVYSKDVIVNKEVTGTTIEIQTDEITLTKFASASTIYDTNVAVFGSLLKVKKVQPTSTSVKSRYELQGADGKLIGDAIELPVESALVDVRQGKLGASVDATTGNYTEGTGDITMDFIYRLEDGNYKLVQIVVSEYFTDSHFGRGLNNQDGVVSLLEGDGNEFLVIGEDTIAVVGVKDAIKEASNNDKSYIDGKIEELTTVVDENHNIATALTETRHNESKAYTDNQIELVTNSVNELSETINTSIAGFNETLKTQIDEVHTSLVAETTNRETADIELRALILANTDDIASLKSEDVAINGKINSLDTLIYTVSGNVEHRIVDVINELTTEMQKGDNTTLEASKAYTNSAVADAKIYTDTTVENAVNDINAKKVVDVVYDGGNKKIFLTFANGSMSTGFDASEFVVDGMLNNVTFDDVRNEIKFIWNIDGGISDITVPLNKFVDQYKIADDSISYLYISEENKISAIVDESNGYKKTLASTDYVKNIGQTVYNQARTHAVADSNKYTDEQVSAVSGIVNTLVTEFKNTDLVITTDINAIKSSIEVMTEKHNSDIANLKNELIGVIDEEILDVKTEISKEVSSLNATIEEKYAELDAYAKTLEARIAELEGNIDSMKNTMEATVKNIIKDYLVGTDKEIKVSEQENKLMIGFDEDAVFGEI